MKTIKDESKRERERERHGKGKGAEIAPLSRQIPTTPRLHFHPFSLPSVSLFLRALLLFTHVVTFCSSYLDFRPGSGLTPVGADATTPSDSICRNKIIPPTVTPVPWKSLARGYEKRLPQSPGNIFRKIAIARLSHAHTF